MGDEEFEEGRTIRSVKAAMDKYRGKINQDTNPMKKLQKHKSDSEEKMPSKAKELHLAKKITDRINETRTISESAKAEAELKLLKAKKTVRELTSQIEDSKSNANVQKEELRILYKAKRVQDERFSEVNNREGHRYGETERDLEGVKRELSKIKLDMASALEEKSLAEKNAENASLRLRSYISSVERLRREIEEANEEEVLVELARIQAQKELVEIEAQRKEEAERFSSSIEETRKKIGYLREEIERVKDLEDKLAVTSSDAEVLQSELKLIEEMNKRAENSGKSKSSDLQSIEEKLDAARNELELIKGGGFRVMASMDVIRNELKNVREEKDRMMKLEEKNEKTMKNLNSKLLRARHKLEVIRASEEKARLMMSSLYVAFEDLQRGKKAAEKEKEVIGEETVNVRTEIRKAECETDLTEKRLHAAMQELERVKSEEARALKKLKTLIENTVRVRASNKKPTITISRFEYDYLTGSAVEAREIAEKKAAAAHAWEEALRASEKEMKIKTGLAKREIKELKLKEYEIHRMEKLLTEKELAEREQGKKRFPGRKSMRDNDNKLTPVRQGKFRVSAGSPVTRRMTSSTSFTMKKRTRVMFRIAKYFASEQIKKESDY